MTRKQRTAARLQRIAAVLKHLEGGSIVTMQHLAWRFSVSVTTINRDIDALRESHRIGGSTGCGGGVMLRKRAA